MPVQYPNLIEIPLPILTPRLLLRSPQAGDGPAYHAAINASREHLARFLPWATGSHLTAEDSEHHARRNHANFISRSDIVLAIFDRHTQELLGGTGWHRLDWELPKVEIGYWVRKDAEGRGIVSEAVNAISRYAFQQLKVKRVEILCETDNGRSRGVAERLGFHLDGILRQNRFKVQSEELTDTYVYSRLNAEGLPDLEVSW